jgi:3-phenylpropionate/cinnamic acid dioxygenase small subunit
MELLNDRVTRFIYHEADLMDEHRFDEWLALWDEELLYWVPCNDNDIDPTRQVSLIYDTRATLEDRLARLKSPAAHSQIPRSRLRRIISNIAINPIQLEQAGIIEVTSNFILAESRHHRQNLFAGKSLHTLELKDDALLIKQKKVLLIDNDDYINNLTFIV